VVQCGGFAATLHHTFFSGVAACGNKSLALWAEISKSSLTHYLNAGKNRIAMIGQISLSGKFWKNLML